MGRGDPSPNPLTQRGLLLFLFPLNFPSRPELWLPEHGAGQPGRWGTVGCASPHPLPLPGLSPSTPAPGHHCGVFAACNRMGHGSFGPAILWGRPWRGCKQVPVGEAACGRWPGPPVTQPAVAEAEVG